MEARNIPLQNVEDQDQLGDEEEEFGEVDIDNVLDSTNRHLSSDQDLILYPLTTNPKFGYQGTSAALAIL